ncbi:MAG: DUF4097 family beta strand repeat-containing protein [Bullifex sp.]
MSNSRKRIFFIILTVIIVAVIFVRRFFPSGENAAFDVTVRKAGSSVSISTGANDVYVKSADVRYPELKSRDETVYLTDDMIYTYSFRAPAAMMITLPKDTGIMEVTGSGDIFISGVRAESISAVTAGGMIDADSVHTEYARLKTVNGQLSVSSSDAGKLILESEGGNVDVMGTETEALDVKTNSGDILAECSFKDALLESSEGTITVYTDTPLRLKHEGELTADEALINDEAERSLSVRTGNAVKILKGE